MTGKARDGSISGNLPEGVEAQGAPIGRQETEHEAKIRKGKKGLEALRVARRRRLKPAEPHKPKHKLGTPRED